MGVLPKTHQTTIDEFERLPEFDGIQELLDGEVIQMPPPKQRHSALVKRIERMLRQQVDESRIWIETGFLIGNHCVQPDVAVIHPNQTMERGWYAGAPLIAIEVASRGNTPDELAFKKELYLSSGAAEVWVVFDKTRTVEWYGAGSLNFTYREMLRSDGLDADLKVGDLFE